MADQRELQVAQVASMLEIDVSVARDALEKVGWDVDGAPKSANSWPL